MGVDFGKKKDFCVAIVLNDSGQLIGFKRFKSVSYSTAIPKIISFARQYNNPKMLVDSQGLGDPLYDYIRTEYPYVKPFNITSTSKPKLIDHLALLLERGEITFPNITPLIHELEVFGIETTKTGYVKYKAPKGFHDDCVIALALAAWHFKKKRLKPASAHINW